MISLNQQQKHLLFDYCIGLTSEQETAQAQELVFSNGEAAKFVASIKASLSPLESITPEECPDELAEGTLWRIKQTLRTSQVGLNQLLAAEQKRKTGFWRDIFGRLATAAVFVIVGSALFTGGKMAASYARQMSWQTQCGVSNGGFVYRPEQLQERQQRPDADPRISTGSPWWKVGDQGSENVSNTRRMWVLVRKGYVKPDRLLCAPSTKPPCSFSCNPKDYNDFPKQKNCYI